MLHPSDLMGQFIDTQRFRESCEWCWQMDHWIKIARGNKCQSARQPTYQRNIYLSIYQWKRWMKKKPILILTLLNSMHNTPAILWHTYFVMHSKHKEYTHTNTLKYSINISYTGHTHGHIAARKHTYLSLHLHSKCFSQLIQQPWLYPHTHTNLYIYRNPFFCSSLLCIRASRSQIYLYQSSQVVHWSNQSIQCSLSPFLTACKLNVRHLRTLHFTTAQKEIPHKITPQSPNQVHLWPYSSFHGARVLGVGQLTCGELTRF